MIIHIQLIAYYVIVLYVLIVLSNTQILDLLSYVFSKYCKLWLDKFGWPLVYYWFRHLNPYSHKIGILAKI